MSSPSPENELSPSPENGPAPAPVTKGPSSEPENEPVTRKRAAVRGVKNVAITAVFTALLLGAQYALWFVKGVELVTLLLLVFSYRFGVKCGVLSAVAFSLLRCFLFGFFPSVILLYLIYYPLFAALFLPHHTALDGGGSRLYGVLHAHRRRDNPPLLRLYKGCGARLFCRVSAHDGGADGVRRPFGGASRPPAALAAESGEIVKQSRHFSRKCQVYFTKNKHSTHGRVLIFWGRAAFFGVEGARQGVGSAAPEMGLQSAASRIYWEQKAAEPQHRVFARTSYAV